ncbi:MAG: N-6 DNA methylase [Flavobacteriales bacterium]|nr:N-6 DNA methylase [Flavobacteriales bacterium]
MPLKKSDLYSTIWQSCDALRGGMDASQYKNYVLTILFVKYISDKYADAGPYAEIKVPKGASFKDMVALKGTDNIGDDINKKILGPIAEANKLSKSDLADFDDPVLLGDGPEKKDKLTDLIAIFQDPALDFSKNRADGDDILGDAYEYLMRHFATESGKSKGQFYTPSEVSRIMASLIGIANAKVTSDTSIYDPTCGSGSLLLKVADAAGTEVTLYGQEKDVATAGLARMNMILHNSPGALIEGGASTIANPKFKEDNGLLKTFDYVVANPPFSDKRWGQGIKPSKDEHKRFEPYGVPPPKQGDYAYLLHIIRSLKSTGKGACILPHGVLFRGNAEADIRKNLIERGYIKGIIGLPPNLFYGTGIPACIVVLDKADAEKRRKDPKGGIYMMDASAGFKKEGAKNRLREMDIHRIVDVFTKQEPVNGYARLVTWDEIERNEFNLNIPRYIDSRPPEDIQDIDGHLNGGIPERDVNALKPYWEVCPALRTTLFKENRSGYVDLAVDKAAIRPAIHEHAEFKQYSAGMEAHYTKWRKPTVTKLKALGKGLHPKPEVKGLGEGVLAHYAGKPLIGAYDVYQLLMDYAEEVLRDDLYILSEEGWGIGAQVRELQKVKVKKDDGEKLVWAEAHDYAIGKRRFKSDLIPGTLLVARYFAKEQTVITELAGAVESLKAELDALNEEHSGEGGALSAVDNVKDAYKAYDEALLDVAATVDEAIGDNIEKARTELADANRRLRELEDAPGIRALANAKGKVTQTLVKARNKSTTDPDELMLTADYLAMVAKKKEANDALKPLLEKAEQLATKRLKDEPEHEDVQELRILTQYLELNEALSGKKAELKKRKEELDALLHAKYPTLSEAEVKILVVEDKWMDTLSAAVHGEMDRISQRLTGRVAELGERYGRTMPSLADDVETLAAKVEGHLKQMDFAWN